MQTKKLFALGCLMLAAVVVAVPGAARADHRVVIAIESEAYQVQGQTVPASSDTNVTWLGKDGARLDMGDSASILMLADRETMYMINHPHKQYTEVAPGLMDQMLKATDSEDPVMAQQRQAMMSMMQVDVKVTETDETRKVGNYDCRKYLISMKMAMSETATEVWASEDISIDYDLYTRISHGMMTQLPGFEKALKEWDKIKGVAVLSSSTTKVMGNDIKTSQKLVEVVEKDAPAGTFVLPKEYKKTEMIMPGMR